MAVPVFLNTAYRYLSTLAVTDVNTIISDLNAELLALPDPWIDNGGVGTGPWQSPTRADGAFIKITAARISATRISWIVNDHNDMLVNNATDTRQDIDAAGTEIRYFTGPFHVCVDSIRAAPETWFCAILDKTPEDLANPRPTYVAHKAPRDTAGTLDGSRYWSYLWMLIVGGTAYTSGYTYAAIRLPQVQVVDRLTVSGALMFVPYEIQENDWFHGRIPQVLLVDSGQAFGAELVVPLDTGVSGTFKVVGCITVYDGRIAFRKA